MRYVTLLLAVLLITGCSNPTPMQLDAPEIAPAPATNVIPSQQAENYVGETVTVQINHTYCSYRPDVNGAPTFCNDRPYPGHDFTLLVWGKDWSNYDGQCIWVKGFVSLYKGKAQIEASSRSQVSPCP